jgi:hypothetical protein
MTEYGTKLNYERSLRKPKGIRGNRQKVIVTHNPSEIDQNQLLLVRFPNLGSDDSIIPGTANLSFDISLESKADTKRTLVNNLGRAIIKRLAVKFEGNEVLSIDDFDIFGCYQDLWKTSGEKSNSIRQGIINKEGNTENCMKIRIDASDKDTTEAGDKKIADVYKNKFVIPLDFEMLIGVMPYYQSGLGNRLCYEITFNNYDKVIYSKPSKTAAGQEVNADAKYKISNISLEYDIITNPKLSMEIASEYQSLVVLYDRILRHKQITVNKSDTVWNWSFNTPCRSLKGILALFKDDSDVSYQRDSSKFYNPNINKVSVIVEGKPNQLYAQGLQKFEHYTEICKYFAEGKQKDNNANEIQKHLELHDVNVKDYLTDKYALWLDFRTIDENTLHGTGRRIENASEGITLQIEKSSESSGKMNAYIYLIMDAQLNIENGEFKSVLY